MGPEDEGKRQSHSNLPSELVGEQPAMSEAEAPGPRCPPGKAVLRVWGPGPEEVHEDPSMSSAGLNGQDRFMTC